MNSTWQLLFGKVIIITAPLLPYQFSACDSITRQSKFQTNEIQTNKKTDNTIFTQVYRKQIKLVYIYIIIHVICFFRESAWSSPWTKKKNTAATNLAKILKRNTQPHGKFGSDASYISYVVSRLRTKHWTTRSNSIRQTNLIFSSKYLNTGGKWGSSRVDTIRNWAMFSLKKKVTA